MVTNIEKPETFAASITEEIFRKQPTQALTKNRPSKGILHKGFGLFLWHRSMTKSNAHPILTPLVQGIVDKILQVTADRYEAGLMRRNVAFAVAEHCPEAYRILMLKDLDSPTNAQRFDTFTAAVQQVKQNSLCIAIALGDRSLIEILLADGASMWEATIAFDLPISVAVEASDISLCRLVLHYMRTSNTHVSMAQRGSLMDKYIRGYWNGREMAKDAGKLRIPIIIEWYLDNLPTPNWAMRTLMFRWCVMAGDTYLLRRLLEVANVTPDQRKEWPNIYLRDTPHAPTLQILLDRGILDPKVSYDQGSLIDHGVMHGDEATVRKALELGPSADGPARPHDPSRWPLKDAIVRGHEHIVRLLLKYGADCETAPGDRDHVRHPQCPLALAKEGSPIYNLLLDATISKIKREGDYYRIPYKQEEFYLNTFPRETWSDNLWKRHIVPVQQGVRTERERLLDELRRLRAPWKRE
jgi:hypothetical protein